MVNAVEGRLLAVGHRDLLSEHVDRLEAEELLDGLIDDAKAGLSDASVAQLQRGDQENNVPVLCGQPVMGGGRGKAYVVPLCDPACKRKQVAVAQRLGA